MLIVLIGKKLEKLVKIDASRNRSRTLEVRTRQTSDVYALTEEEENRI